MYHLCPEEYFLGCESICIVRPFDCCAVHIALCVRIAPVGEILYSCSGFAGSLCLMSDWDQGLTGVPLKCQVALEAELKQVGALPLPVFPNTGAALG